MLVAYDSRDPDRAALSVPLDEEESEALALLLGGASMVHRIGDAAGLPGLTTARIQIEPDSLVA